MWMLTWKTAPCKAMKAAAVAVVMVMVMAMAMATMMVLSI
jgi:hypothetical protein